MDEQRIKEELLFQLVDEQELEQKKEELFWTRIVGSQFQNLIFTNITPTLPSLHAIHSQKELEKKQRVLDRIERKIFESNECYSPPALTNCSMISITGKRKLMIFGGLTDTMKCTNETWLFDLGTKTWKPMSSFVKKDNLYRDFDPLQAMVKSTAATTTKHSTNQMFYQMQPVQLVSQIIPPARCGHACVSFHDSITLKDRIYLFGGQNITTLTLYNDLWYFELQPLPKWKVLNPMGPKPIVRWNFSMNLLENKIFIFGGETQHSQLLNDLCVYSILTNEYQVLKTIFPYPKARMLHSASIVDHYLVIIGGVTSVSSQVEEFTTIWLLDTRIMCWKELQMDKNQPNPFLIAPNHFQPLFGHGCVTWGKKLIVIGGKLGFNTVIEKNQVKQDLLEELWIFDIYINKWTKMEKNWKGMFPCLRYQHAICTDHYVHIAAKNYKTKNKEAMDLLISEHQFKTALEQKEEQQLLQQEKNQNAANQSPIMTSQQSKQTDFKKSVKKQALSNSNSSSFIHTTSTSSVLSTPKRTILQQLQNKADEKQTNIVAPKIEDGTNILAAIELDTPIGLQRVNVSAEMLLQKYTKIYIYGGTSTVVLQDLWELGTPMSV